MSEQENLEVARLAIASEAWITRGRVSGLDGRWPFNILLTFRDGKIASHEWFTDRDVAVAAARTA